MKFAYLIMAHHRFDVLKMLLSDLDYKDNDIYLHVDKKTKGFSADEVKKCVKYSRLIIVKSIPVYWGHSSQIKCVLNLLSTARKTEKYDYYHLLVGVEFPLLSQERIHSFFEENRGKEFIGFDKVQGFEDRIKYYYFGYKYYRNSNNRMERILLAAGGKLLSFQKSIGINRLKHGADYYKKGYANWSISNDLASYFIENKKSILKDYKWTFCADEICFHTLVFHSHFYNEVFDKNNEYHSAMRITTWDDPYNQFHLSDVPMLLKANRLFARKFDDKDAITIISTIIKNREC